MPGMAIDNRTDIALVVGGDAQPAELTARLARELRALDLDRIEHPEAAPLPLNARGSALEWAQLAVTLVGALPPFVATVMAFVRRNPGTRVTVEIDGDALTIAGGRTDEQLRLARAWLDRNGT
jgi:hypothetical protein